MAINGVSIMQNSLASLATSMQSDYGKQNIGVAIMKQILDSQEMQAQALISMMSAPTPTINGTGRIVNIRA